MRVSGVSFSSDRKLSRCEMQYSYRYDQGLKLKTKQKGLYMGDWMHQLEEAYYKGDWHKKYGELVKTNWDKLFDEERDMYEERGFTPQVAFDLMEHYAEHWGPIEQDWEILHVEESHELMLKAGFPVRW